MLSRLRPPFTEAPEAESSDVTSIVETPATLIVEFTSANTNSISAEKSGETTPLSSSSTKANPAEEAVS